MSSPAYPRFRARLLLALVLAGIAVFVALRVRDRAKGNEDAARAAITKVLNDQVEAWNNGDLDGFMAGYWRSDELTCFSGGDVRQGWEDSLEHYRKDYQAEGKEMGRLKFDNLVIDVLAPKAALVRGRWQLTFKDGHTIGGLFTLLFRDEEKQGWCIVHDHTSAAK